MDQISKAAWLESLTVEKTQDEFGLDRYFVSDYSGDWIGEPFSSREEALERIAEMRKGD